MVKVVINIYGVDFDVFDWSVVDIVVVFFRMLGVVDV